MADGTVVIDTDLDASGFTNGVKSLGSVASKGLGAVTSAVKVTSTALVGLTGAATVVGMGFEASMSQVAATMGLTAEEINNGSESFETLRQAAKDAGATTQFSASQSAEALNYLALAGYSAEKAVETLPTVLNLAAAGGMELAYASDLVTDSMSALGDMAGSVDNFVDKLAVTSQKSNTSISQLGEAILTVGGTAKVLAGGTTELNTALGILADNGIKGAEGGTALRNIILSLSAPTDKAAKKMKELGLQVLDAEGNMRPMNDLFNDLNGILLDMTQGEQTQVLNELFNKTDLKSVNALLANSGERFDELSAYINDCNGSAANMADTMNNNLKGKITQLGSALEGLGIEIYESIDAGLKSAVDEAITNVGRLTDAFKNNGFEGLIEEAGAVLSEFMVKVAEYAPKVVDTAVQLIQSFITAIQDNLPTIVQSALKIGQSVLEGIIETLPQILEMGIQVIHELIVGLTQTIPDLIPVAIDAIITMATTLIDNMDLIIDAGIELIFALIEGIIEALPTLIEKVPEIINSFWEAFDRNLFKIVQAGLQLIVKLGQGIIENIPLIIDNAGEIVTAIWNTISHINLFQLGKNLMTKLGDGIKGMIGNIKSAMSDIGKNIMEGVWNGINSMKQWLSDKVSGIFSGIVNTAKKVLGIHSPSRVFRDQVGKFMAEGVSVGFEEESANVEKDMQKNLQDITAKMRHTVDLENDNMSASIVSKSIYESKVNSEDDEDSEGKTVIETTVVIDGREFAKATTPYIDKELNKTANRKKRGG